MLQIASYISPTGLNQYFMLRKPVLSAQLLFQEIASYPTNDHIYSTHHIYRNQLDSIYLEFTMILLPSSETDSKIDFLN